MTMRAKRSKAVLLFLLFFSVAGFGIAAFVDEGKIYNALEKAFYLSPEDGVWIRPGLNLAIQNVTIPSDRKPVVTFRVTDDRGQALDREGNVTPGLVTTSWILAYIPQNADKYVAYTVRRQTSPITNVSAIQASSDSGGRYESLGDGTYRYIFGTALPSTYDSSATHTLGVYSTRDLTEFGLTRYVANEVHNFVPDGRQVTKIRDVTPTVACNSCHDPLALHGGSRRTMEVCILCHSPQTSDPDTGNTVDMAVMTHRIHRGANLPSVQAGKPYVIIGNRQSVHDYSDVVFPQDIRNCTACHRDSAQVNNWLLNPTRDNCGSCHDDIDWRSGANHAAGPQTDDQYCSRCHWPQSEFEYDASIAGAHVATYKSKQLRNPKFEVLEVTNTGAGQSPTVRFKITDKTGAAMAPSAMNSFALTLAGPTSDYTWYVRETSTAAQYADGIGTYTFKAAIPAGATGTYVVEADGYVNAVLNPGTAKQETYRDAFDNVVRPFAVTGEVVPRRQVVDLQKCNACHGKLQLHGNNRNQIEACVVCHNPATTDTARRPATDQPPESIDMKLMIHRIHTGLELANDYTVYGFGNTPHNYNHVGYPGDRRNCLACHTENSFTVPLPSTTATTTPRGYWDPTKPTAAACLGCHDSVESAAHAFLNTATFGEACAVCHREGAEFGVLKVHAR